jgi:ribose transport system permease protein
VSYATRTLVQAAALAVGVALYTVNWGSLARRFLGRRPASLAPT